MSIPNLFELHKFKIRKNECLNRNCTTCGAMEIRKLLYENLFNDLKIKNIFSRAMFETSKENQVIVINFLYATLNQLSDKEVRYILDNPLSDYRSFTENIVVYVILEIYFLLIRFKSINYHEEVSPEQKYVNFKEFRENILDELNSNIINLEARSLIQKMDRYYTQK